MPTNIKKFQFFDYGYPAEHETQYGLFQPTLDCFVVVHPNLEVLKIAKILLSSRYSLYIVKLTDAVNYTYNLIDNEICENWSIENKQAINVGKSMTTDLISATGLVPAQHNIEWDINNEKIWALTVCWWIGFIDDTRLKYYKYLHYDQILRDINNNPVIDSYHENFYHTQQKIYEILYMDEDTDTAISKLKSIVCKNQIFNDNYNASKNYIRQPDSN